MSHTVVMVTTSYPRFAGDTVGTFMEPIARGVAARGHEVHVVAPWHPRVARAAVEEGVHLHYFRYAPARLAVFGYAEGLRADERLRGAAYLTAPVALAAGAVLARRVARRRRATVLHGHWVVPGGVIATAAAGRLPVVLSLHGSDVYVAERHRLIGLAARRAFRRAGWVTACSEDLRTRALPLGADARRTEVVPYGVDANRFAPDPERGARIRRSLGLAAGAPVVFTAGRLVRKKGFEFLIDAVARLAPAWDGLRLVVAGSGDLDAELRRRVQQAGLTDRVLFLGDVPQHAIPGLLNAADVVAVPSVRDRSGNVDGLPNALLEALASGTAVLTTDVGGISSVAEDDATARIVPPADPTALAAALDELLRDPARRRRLGAAARERIVRERNWRDVAARLEAAYDRVTGHAAGTG